MGILSKLVFSWREILKMRCLALIAIALSISFNTIEAKEIVLARSATALNDVAEVVIKEAYKRANISVTIKTFPDKRSLIKANDGEIDGDVLRGKFITKEYTNLLIVPVPIFKAKIHAFSNGKKLNIKSWNDLQSYRLAYRVGVFLIEKNTKGMNVEFVENEIQSFQLLSTGRTEVVIEFYISALKAINHLSNNNFNTENIIKIEPALFEDAGYHVLHKKNKIIIPKLAEALTELQKSGFIKDIYNRFVSKP